MKLKHFYDSIYYTIYCNVAKNWRNPYEYDRAFLLLSIFNAINFITPIIWLMIIFDIKTKPFPFEYVLFSFAFPLLQNYYMFMYKKKYIKLIEEFKMEDESDKRSRIAYTGLYIILSIVSLLITLLIYGLLNKK